MSANSRNVTPPNPDWYIQQQQSPIVPNAPKRQASSSPNSPLKNARMRFDESPNSRLQLGHLFANAVVVHQLPDNFIEMDLDMNADRGLGYQGRRLFTQLSPASSDDALGSDLHEDQD